MCVRWHIIFIQYWIVLGNLLPLVRTWWCRNQSALSDIGKNQTLITFLTNIKAYFFLYDWGSNPGYHSCPALQGTFFNDCFRLMLALFLCRNNNFTKVLCFEKYFQQWMVSFCSVSWSFFCLLFLSLAACICSVAWICLRYNFWLLEQRATFYLIW